MRIYKSSFVFVTILLVLTSQFLLLEAAGRRPVTKGRSVPARRPAASTPARRPAITTKTVKKPSSTSAPAAAPDLSEAKKNYLKFYKDKLEQLKKNKKWGMVADLSRALIDAEKNEPIENNKVPGIKELAETNLKEATTALNTGLYNNLTNLGSQGWNWVRSFWNPNVR